MIEFIRIVKNNIRNYLPQDYKDARVVISEVSKINSTGYMGIGIIRKGENVTAYQRLEPFIEEYQAGTQIETILEELADSISIGKMEPVIDLYSFYDYEQAKKSLILKVCGTDGNELYLQDAPHTLVENLAITYHLLIHKTPGLYTCKIDHKLMEMWDITLEELHTDTLKSAPLLLPYKCSEITEVIHEMLGSAETNNDTVDADTGLLMYENCDRQDAAKWILTNEIGNAGAATLFYPEVMDQAAEKIGGSYFIIPSSIHEVVLIKKGEMPVNTMLSMIKEINRCITLPEEILSDQVYYYDAIQRRFGKAKEN